MVGASSDAALAGTSPTGPRFAMVAGETSGDLLAGAVLRGLRAKAPHLAAAGIGGPAMVAEGFDAWWPSDALAVRGYAEVLREYPRLWRLRRELGKRLLADRPDLFVGVDAPDFNLGLAARLKRSGVRTAHFVSPSIWAWRGGRIHSIGRAVDRMLVVFPFEQGLYERAGIDAVYVGHPLADAIPLVSDPEAARARIGLQQRAPVVALLPGSRASEIHYMAQTFLETARWLLAQRGDLQFVLPAATAAIRARLDALLAADAALAAALDGRLRITDGGSHDALAACDATLIASGTATLEAALFRKPMVIAYRMASATYIAMRRMGYLPWIGLPNILCNESLVPEFVQHAATPQALGQALLAQLDDEQVRERLAQRFAQLHDALRCDCARRAAQALLEMVECPRA